MKFIRELIPYLIIILVVLILRTFIVTPIIVSGESMVPTLDGGELMLLKKYDTSYERFDIVVVNKNVEGDNLIKRVIGLPGETIKYRNEKLYINDKVIEDTYAFGETGNFKEIILAEDEYFLMGDNRPNSTDSRCFGCVPYDKIESRVVIRFWPLAKFGTVE